MDKCFRTVDSVFLQPQLIPQPCNWLTIGYYCEHKKLTSEVEHSLDSFNLSIHRKRSGRIASLTFPIAGYSLKLLNGYKALRGVFYVFFACEVMCVGGMSVGVTK